MYPDYELNFPNSKDKRLPTMYAYAHLLNNENSPDDLFINNIGCISNDPDCFAAVQVNENYFKLIPGHEFSPRLYRGQNKFRELCYSSKFRRDIGTIKQIADAVRKEEFILLIKENPILVGLERIKINDLYFQTDFEGLAQHYGFRTSYLDASRSKDIAMFFATCAYDANEGIYKPIIADDRIGVIYTIDLFQGLTTKNKRVDVVGLQALPRPGAQKAFSITLTNKENFNNLAYVKFEKFKITRELSEAYFNKFNCGKDLFPEDIVDYKAKQIRNCELLSKDAFIIYCQKQGIKSKKDQKRIKTKLLKKDIRFREQNIKFTRGELSSIKDKWIGMRSKFINKIKARFVADPL